MRNQAHSPKRTDVASQFLRERDYWLKRLSGELIKAGFPGDRLRSAGAEPVPATFTFQWSGRLYDRLLEISNRSDARLHIILVAGLAVLLNKYTGLRDMVIGVPIYKQDMEGELVNTLLPLRMYLEGDMPFKELLLQVHQALFEAVEHQNYPLEVLLEHLNIIREDTGCPLFEMLVMMEGIHDRSYIRDIQPAMVFVFSGNGGCLQGKLEYDASRFSREMAVRIMSRLSRLLQQALADVNVNITGIDVLSPQERRQLVFDFNDTGADYPRDKSIHHLFEEQARGRPDQPAVVWRSQTIQYGALNERADRLALRLRARGIGPDTIAALLLERSVEMIPAILGVLKAGGGYLPIDPRYPADRVRYMLEDSSAVIVLTDDKSRSTAEAAVYSSSVIISVDEADGQAIQPSPATPVPLGDGRRCSRNLAYIIYTSGTTGKPKGVLVTHRNVVRLMTNQRSPFDFSSRDVWTLFHSYSFDFSVWEMYGALLYGGKLVVIPQMVARDPGKFLNVLRLESVTILNQTPSAFYQLMDRELKQPDRKLALRYVIFGGEALNPGRLKEWKEKYPDIKLINMFGITETTVHVTFKEISRREIAAGVSNIGTPLPTLSCYVVDDDSRLLPIDASGELCVGGHGVARGYLNRPELTARRFVANPYKPDDRMYRSGDLARFRDDGEMVYLGRIDHQVKIRGFRIELGEIENRLLRHEGIKEAVVLMREDEAGGRSLCAYFVPLPADDGGTVVSLKTALLKEFLIRYLPDYMVPAYFVPVESIPLNPNGKVDKRALPEPGIYTDHRYVAPKSDLEKELVRIWESVLEIRRPGIRDGFFSVGGDSIRAISLLSLINNELGTRLEIADLYLNDTVENLARRIGRDKMVVIEGERQQAAVNIENLKQRITAAHKLPPDVEDLYPLSDVQKGMVFYSLKDLPTAVYHDQMIHQVKFHRFEPAVFRKAMKLMTRKHSILRTSYNIGDYEEAVQIVHKKCRLDVKHLDISHLSRQKQIDYLKGFMVKDRQRPLNLAVPPLWRLRTFSLDDENIVLLWICHHSIIDGWSDAAFKTELNNIYLRLREDSRYVPPPLKNSYKQFVIQQMAAREREETSRFWQRELLDYRRLDFSAIMEPHDVPGGRHVMIHDLGGSLLVALNETANRCRTSVKHLCLAAYAYMLNMLSYENDIATGVISHNRPDCEDGEKILGCFLNSVPIRVRIPENINWSDYAGIVEQKMRQVKKHDRLSLFEISRLIGERSEDRKPVSDAVFNFVDFHVYQGLEGGGDSVQHRPDHLLPLTGYANADNMFEFTVNTTTGSLVLKISHYNSISHREVKENLCSYFEKILKKFIHEPQAPVRKDDLLPERERHLLLMEFNRTDVPYPGDRTLHRLFREQARRTPQQVALSAPAEKAAERRRGSTHISYLELGRRADRLSCRLRERGIGTGSIVGMLMERSPDLAVTILGILKSGGACLPLDPAVPEERADFILRECRCPVLLTTTGLMRSHAMFPQEPACPVVTIDDETPGGGNSVEEVSMSADDPLNMAYIIFTSGSTGRPKGVVLHHRGIINHVFIKIREVNAGASDIFSHNLHIGFVASIWQVFAPLFIGARLLIYPRELVSDAYEFFRQADRDQVTILEVVPSFLKFYLDVLESGRDKVPLRRLKSLILTGERVSPRLVNRFFRLYRLDLVNAYGQSECSDDTLHYQIPCRTDAVDVPIGKPSANTRIYVLSREGQLQHRGVPGELWIGGDGLARGYINNPGLSAERFVDRSFDGAAAVGRLYRSGDLVSWGDDGTVRFLGRIDLQVKIRGNRVELGEIEARLLKHEAVKEAVVLATLRGGFAEDQGDDLMLCAYFVSDRPPAADELKEFLSARLPDYMVPAHFRLLERIPMLPNGKIDRNALPAPDERAATSALPTDEVEKALARIWCDVLMLEEETVGIDTSFFEVGGHSLNAATLVARIHKQFTVRVTLPELFKTSTIGDLSRYIRGVKKEAFQSIVPVEQREYYPLSAAQKRIYVLQHMEPENTAYNISHVLRLESPLNRQRFEATLKHMIRRHESLRTSFEMVGEEPVQRIHGGAGAAVEYHDLDPRSPVLNRQPEEIVTGFVRPFDLSRPPLIRVGLIKVGEPVHILMLDMHHIVTDGTSNIIFTREFALMYGGTDPPPLRIQYRDYSQWQSAQFGLEEFKRQEAYWLEKFRGELPLLDLPTDYPRPQNQSFAGGRFAFTLEPGRTEALKELARQNDATLFMLVLACLNVLLSRLSNQTDVVVGTAVAGRRHTHLEYLVGMFVRTLALRHHPEEEKTFREFLAEVKQGSLGAFENQEYPFESMVERIAVDRDLSRNPVFDVMLLFQNLQTQAVGLPAIDPADLQMKPYRYENKTAKFDLTLITLETGGTLTFTLEYCTRLFREETIRRFAGYFKKITAAVTENHDQKLYEIDMLEEEEKICLLHEFNRTAARFPEKKTVHQLLQDCSRRTPSATAVVFAHQKMTFRMLDERADRLGRLLGSRGVRPGKIVGLMPERSIEMLVGLYAVLKAGGAYLPIGPEYPEQRIRYMLEHSGAEILLCSGRRPTAFHHARIDLLDPRNYTAAADGDDLPARGTAADLAYVSYTSGSTGKPKGVMVAHRAVVNFITGIAAVIEFRREDCILSLTTISFDIFGLETLLPLGRGARVVVGSEEEQLNPAAIARALQREMISIFQVTPSRLQLILVDVESAENLKCLKYLLVGGEAFPDLLLKRVKPYVTGRIFNLYGPTETTIWSTVKEVTREETVTIGRPIINTRIYIVNRRGGVQPLGVAGELCIAGDGLARGYLKDDPLTDEKFVNNPFEPGTKLYRTGDLARWLSNGEIEFQRRLDHQVKLRGFRIELGEIESLLKGHPDIEDVVVDVKRDSAGEKVLCAYIVAGTTLETAGLRMFLAADLPEYMIPGYFMFLEHLPLTPNGKLDRKALPVPEADGRGAGETAPRDMVEGELVDIWSEVLGRRRDSLGIDTNFFEVGGNSLKAIMTVTRIHRRFNVKIPMGEVFRRPTITGLADCIRRGKRSGFTSIPVVEKKEYYRLSSAQNRLYALQQIHPDSTAYNTSQLVKLSGSPSLNQMTETFRRLIDRHEILRTSFIVITGETVQRVESQVPFNIEYYDTAISTDEFIRPFDPARPPLFRVGIMKKEADHHVLMVDMHHIISDGISHNILVQDFMTLNEGETLPPVKIQYKDYTEWQKGEDQRRAIKKQEAFWLETFAGEVPVLNLPADFSRPSVQEFAGSRLSFEIGPEETRELNRLVRSEGATLYIVLLTVFNIFLAKICRQQDIIVGAPVSGRRHTDLENTIGMFVNMLALRNYPEDKKSFIDFLREVKERSIQAFENQEYQFENLLEKVLKHRDLSRNPLFGTSFTFQNMMNPGGSDGRRARWAVRLKLFGNELNLAKHDLDLVGAEDRDRLYFILFYSTRLFKQETVARFINYLKQVVSVVIRNPRVIIKDIDVLSAEEKQRIRRQLREVQHEIQADFDI